MHSMDCKRLAEGYPGAHSHKLTANASERRGSEFDHSRFCDTTWCSFACYPAALSFQLTFCSEEQPPLVDRPSNARHLWEHTKSLWKEQWLIRFGRRLKDEVVIDWKTCGQFFMEKAWWRRKSRPVDSKDIPETLLDKIPGEYQRWTGLTIRRY